MGNLWEESAGRSRHCTADATSVVGLRALVREHPDDWRERLRRGVPGRVRIHRGLTLRAVLEAGAWPRLMPKPGGSAEGLRQPRASARRLVERMGGLAILRIDEQVVRAVQAQIEAEGVSGAQISRDLSLLRRVVRSYQLLMGEPGLVRARTPGNTRRGPGRARKVPPVWVGVEIMKRARSISVKGRVALACGGGLREAESQRLRVMDVDPKGSRVWVRALKNGAPMEDRGRWVDLPEWVMVVVMARVMEVWVYGTEALLFSRPGKPREAARSCAKAVRAICEASGVGLPDVYTLGELRRGWQAVARANGLCHRLMRGTMVEKRESPSAEIIATAYPAARRMNAAWTSARRPPGLAYYGRVAVPRRVKGLGDWDPEPLEGEGWPGRERDRRG